MAYRYKKNSIPDRWLYCPQISGIIQDKFLAFKTPLSCTFNDNVPLEHRFSIQTLFDSWRKQNLHVGLWIDLTNTTRYYLKYDVTRNDCQYVKIRCQGHKSTPSISQTEEFVNLCKNFINENPSQLIAVHCTHGFNQTGFLIISYLIETSSHGVDKCIAQFATARPPGIYKTDYIDELYKRYDDIKNSKLAPVQPSWCLEHYQAHRAGGPGISNSLYIVQLPDIEAQERNNPLFITYVKDVLPITNYRTCHKIEKRIEEMCIWNTANLPGSFDFNIDMVYTRYNEKPEYLHNENTRRYLMLILGEGNINFIDESNNIFEVKNLHFPHLQHGQSITETLLDGEMVIDEYQGTVFIRYHVYDIIMYEGQVVSTCPFYPDRFMIIENEIIGGRHEAIRNERLNREEEPFSIVFKYFSIYDYNI